MPKSNDVLFIVYSVACSEIVTLENTPDKLPLYTNWTFLVDGDNCIVSVPLSEVLVHNASLQVLPLADSLTYQFISVAPPCASYVKVNLSGTPVNVIVAILSSQLYAPWFDAMVIPSFFHIRIPSLLIPVAFPHSILNPLFSATYLERLLLFIFSGRSPPHASPLHAKAQVIIRIIYSSFCFIILV